MKAISSSPTTLIPAATNYSGGGSYTLTGLTVGKDYVYLKGANDTNCTVTTTTLILAASGVFTATATSVTLTGTSSAAITAIVALLQPIRLYASTFTPTQPTRQVSIGQFPANNPNWSRVVQASNEALYGKRGTAAVALNIADFLNLCLAQETGLTWTPPVILTAPLPATCFGLAKATGTYTNDGTNFSNGDTVSIQFQTYTFQTSLTNVNGNVKIGASAAASMTNLFNAINATGGGTPGTDYAMATTPNTLVTATNPTSLTVVVTAINAGLQSNLDGTTTTATHGSWGGASLTGGTVSPASFVVVEGSEYTVTYQWQYSTDNVNWTNATGTVSGCVYTGDTTATLTCSPTTQGQSGKYHRCQITDNAGSFGLTNGVTNTTGQILGIN